MEFEGDSPAPRPPAPLESPGVQNITVTPENVVALAVVFRECADRISAELPLARRETWDSGLWLGDPVSRWVEHRLRDYLHDSETALFQVLYEVYDRYAAVTKALIAVGEHYELTDELAAAGFVDVGTAE